MQKTKKIKCYKCKGRGWLVDIDWFFGVFTLGITALMDLASKRYPCDACGGKGYLEE